MKYLTGDDKVNCRSMEVKLAHIFYKENKDVDITPELIESWYLKKQPNLEKLKQNIQLLINKNK